MLNKNTQNILIFVLMLALFVLFTMDDTPVFAADGSDDFVITVSAGSAYPYQFNIPTYPGETYNYSVDCNDDGVIEKTGATADYLCKYDDPGNYTIRIIHKSDGTGFPRIYFNDGMYKNQLLSIDQWGKGQWTSMAHAFQGCWNLSGQASDVPNLINVTDMSYMFYNAYAFNQYVEKWDTSKVLDMSYMFYGASAFNQEIGVWDTSSVTNMSYMFYNAANFDKPIGAWETSNVKYMYRMFRGASAFNQYIGDWDTTNLENVIEMFYGASAFNQSLNKWNVGKIQSMQYMFSGASAFNGNIVNWDTSNVLSMLGMFDHASAFNQYIGDWDTGNVNNMSGMFHNASAFNQPIGKWDTSNVEFMNLMFAGASAFDQDLSGWDVRSLVGAAEMFYQVALSPTNYDALLIGWNAQDLKPAVTFSGGYSTYCYGESARKHMIDLDGWTITDGGENCSLIFTVKTDNSGTSDDNQFTIPTTDTGYNYDVDCASDGEYEFIHQTGDVTCQYSAPGTYRIRIKHQSDETGFPRIYFNGSGDAQKLLSIDQWGLGSWTSMASAFKGCSNMVLRASDNPNLSGVTNMSYMFAGASALNQPIGDWDTGNVENMNWMFYGATSFNQPIGVWDTSSVKYMGYMFARTSDFNQPIGAWNTSSVKDMSHMFDNANAFNQPIGGWDTSSVNHMSAMFQYAIAFNQPLGDWDTSSVWYMGHMFDHASKFNQPLGDWDTSNVIRMAYMFAYASDFNQPIGDWDTKKVDDMTGMLNHASSFNQPIGGWDTSKVLNMSYMFAHAPAFNQPIGEWVTSSVWNMNLMFRGASAFDQDLSGWDVTSLTCAVAMFDQIALSPAHYDALLIGWDAQDLNPDVTFSGGNSTYCIGESAREHMINSDSWDITDGGKDCSFVITVKTDNIGTSNDNQFTIPTIGTGYDYAVDCDSNGESEATGLGDNYTCDYPSPGTYTIRIKQKSDETGFPRIFFNGGGDAKKLLSIDQWGMGNWTSMGHAFQGCSNMVLQAIDSPDLSGVTDMSFMFTGASALNQPIGDWETGGVIDMRAMFADATSFNQPIGGWNTTSVTNMGDMFINATSFNQPIGGWDTSSVEYMRGMFGSNSAFNQDIRGWVTNRVIDMSWMFHKAVSFNQPIGGWDTSSVALMRGMFSGATSFNQDLSEWDVTSLTDALGMFDQIALSTLNYDSLLIGWDAQALQPNVVFDGGMSTYCRGESARQNMIDSDSWTITDGGMNCTPEIFIFLPLVIVFAP